MRMSITFCITALLLLCRLSSGIWTEFDLVRPFRAWGSNETTPYVKISRLSMNGPNITAGSYFGTSVANIGDLNQDGIDDLAVGAIGEDIKYDNLTQPNAGAIYILFMGHNASVKSTVRINGLNNNGPRTYAGDQFGYSLASIGDLDGDGIDELAVGAPGTITSSVYVLYLLRNGTVNRYVRIRGRYSRQSSVNNTGSSVDDDDSVIPINGPPIRYGSRFGSALCSIGDFDHDGIPDLAVSALDSSSGFSVIYLMFMDANATVRDYVSLVSNVNGLPEIPTFSGFGASLVLMPDLDNNSVPELAIGAPNLYVPGSLNVRSGQVYICFLTANGSVNHTTILTETSGQLAQGTEDPLLKLPSERYDLCGTAVTSIGDINRDAYRQRHPTELSPEDRPSIADLVVGCPQTGADGKPGRLFFLYLSAKDRQIIGYSEMPNPIKDTLRLHLDTVMTPFGQFGAALAAYTDIDKNGLREIVVGAPTDTDSGTASGAIYVIYPRRKRHHPPMFDYVRFYMLTIFLPVTCCSLFWMGIAWFCWTFRRIPDEIEIIVKKSGYVFDPSKPRLRYQKRPDQVYCDHYTA